MSMHSEIFEQPERLEQLLSSQSKNAQKIAKMIQESEINFAFIAARGTSDNAARYANYLWGAMNGIPVALATPSLFSFYKQPPLLKNALVVGVSQSGRSPDIVSVIDEGNRQGNLTLAITNAPDSPLAQRSDLVFDIGAGPELAVAATKTYTAELMAIAMLSTALAGQAEGWNELALVPGWVSEALKLDQAINQSVPRYRYMQQCAVLGRGFNYATTFEWALKLKELTYINAEPYSSADFMHGPIAMVDQGFPVLSVVPTGKLFSSLLELDQHLKDDLLAELVIISNSFEALSLAQTPLDIPENVPEWLSPLVCIIPAQLFSYHLTLAKGFDAEQPRSISKVTETH